MVSALSSGKHHCLMAMSLLSRFSSNIYLSRKQPVLLSSSLWRKPPRRRIYSSWIHGRVCFCRQIRASWEQGTQTKLPSAYNNLNTKGCSWTPSEIKRKRWHKKITGAVSLTHTSQYSYPLLENACYIRRICFSPLLIFLWHVVKIVWHMQFCILPFQLNIFNLTFKKYIWNKILLKFDFEIMKSFRKFKNHYYPKPTASI